MGAKSWVLGAGGALLMTTVPVSWEPRSFPFQELALQELTAQASPLEEQTAVNVYRSVLPAVVTVSQGSSSGSGTIISADGLVLTNEHVVRRLTGSTVSVRTSTNQTYSGRVVAIDRTNDLALIRLQTNGDRLPFVRLAEPSAVEVGRRVYAIGSPFGLAGTLTTGILSRIAPNGDLQTDAALNPGNSGGPLLNSEGELIGVNKAILSPNGRDRTGIGFATSVAAVQTFLARANSGDPGVVAKTPPRLGVTVDTRTLTIEEVAADSIASRIGLRPGDRLVALNGRPLTDPRQLQEYLNDQPEALVLTISRNQRLGSVRVVF